MPAGQLVVCALGAEEYGLPVEQVREIVRYLAPRPVGGGAAWMRGVIGLRGQLLPVHDLAVLLGLAQAPGEPPASAKLVVVEAGGEPVALLVDEVVEVRHVEETALERVPSGEGRIARIGERLVLLLDAAELTDDRCAASS